MKAKHILVPLDILRGKTDTLLYLQRLALETPLSATLLYVVELNVEQPDPALCGQISTEGETVLRKLALRFLGHEAAARLRVRAGCAREQILAEARSCRSDLILLSNARPRKWFHFFRSRTVEHIAQFAPCPTLVLPRSWPATSVESQLRISAQRASPSSGSPLRPTWAGV